MLIAEGLFIDIRGRYHVSNFSKNDLRIITIKKRVSADHV